MSDCCQAKARELSSGEAAFGRVLWVVLAINGIMFAVEFGAGIAAGSTALMADSLDMLGDAAVYGVSLVALRRSDTWRAGAALLKGGLMAAFGLGVLGQLAWHLVTGTMPVAAMMTGFGLAALGANLVCAALLLRHRGGDVNMRSTWLCSRNDVVANLGVLAAAGLVSLTGRQWPDLVVGLIIALLFLRSALQVLRDALSGLASRSAERPAAPSATP
jgi:Co/Zn/Cd efflux system component